jgi:5-formyltetrahydrofolate cyclo-ligase
MTDRNEVRLRVWKMLRQVAKPDSRFHFNFAEFIPDFQGSDKATERLIQMEIYRQAEVIFITPDNCLEQLRAQAIRDRKVLIISTYGIRRGLIELLPEDVPDGLTNYAVLLDVIEDLGRHISLGELKERYGKVDVLVTGASVVTLNGSRFGKGHGFFDLEWAMFYQIGVVNAHTPVIAFVHDCQVVDLELPVHEYDTICDYIVTPTMIFNVENPHKPVTGVIWDRLEPGMLENISPLKELKNMGATNAIEQ